MLHFRHRPATRAASPVDIATHATEQTPLITSADHASPSSSEAAPDRPPPVPHAVHGPERAACAAGSRSDAPCVVDVVPFAVDSDVTEHAAAVAAARPRDFMVALTRVSKFYGGFMSLRPPVRSQVGTAKY